MFLLKRPNGFYYVAYYKPNGKRTLKSTNTKSKTEAQRYLKKFEVQFIDEKFSEITPIKLKDFIWKFLIYSESVHTWKTTKAFRNSFNFFLEHIGDVSIDSITVRIAEEYLQYRIRSKSIYAARKDHINLSSAFSKAVREGYLLVNPFKNIKRLKIPERLPVYFSNADLERLLKTMNSPDVADITLFTVNTGLRQAEVTSLRWEQIDFTRRLFILDNRGHITKSKKIRTIPLNPTAFSILERRKQGSSSESVFTLSDKPIQPDWLSKLFKSYVRKAKLNDKLSFHSLRHTFASKLVQSGVSIYVVSKLLGHADIKTTEIYSHLRQDDLMMAVNKLNL